MDLIVNGEEPMVGESDGGKQELLVLMPPGKGTWRDQRCSGPGSTIQRQSNT